MNSEFRSQLYILADITECPHHWPIGQPPPIDELAMLRAEAGRSPAPIDQPQSPELPPEPPLSVQAANFAEALGRWAAAGFPIASREIIASRRATCDGCELWDASARLGLGKCNACGCTSIKYWLATERCPKGKWPA